MWKCLHQTFPHPLPDYRCRPFLWQHRRHDWLSSQLSHEILLAVLHPSNMHGESHSLHSIRMPSHCSPQTAAAAASAGQPGKYNLCGIPVKSSFSAFHLKYLLAFKWSGMLYEQHFLLRILKFLSFRERLLLRWSSTLLWSTTMNTYTHGGGMA